MGDLLHGGVPEGQHHRGRECGLAVVGGLVFLGIKAKKKREQALEEE